MRIRFSTTLSTADGTHLSGSIADVSDERARDYVSGGVATLAPADMTPDELLAKIAGLEDANRRLRSELAVANERLVDAGKVGPITADRPTGTPVESVAPVRRRPPAFPGPVAAGNVGGPPPTPETGTLATDGSPADPVPSAATANADAGVDPQATANTGRTVTVAGVADDPATSSPDAPVPPAVGLASPGVLPDTHAADAAASLPGPAVPGAAASVPANGNAANVAGLSVSGAVDTGNHDVTSYDAQPGPSQRSQAKARSKAKADAKAGKGKPGKAK